MAHYNSSTGDFTSEFPSIPIPSNLSISEFFFSYSPPPPCGPRPLPPIKSGQSTLIDLGKDEGGTGKSYTWDEMQQRTDALAKVLRGQYGVAETRERQPVVAIYCENAIDFLPLCLATFRCGGAVSPANPNYTASELAYYFNLVKRRHPLACVVASPDPSSISNATKALKAADIPISRLLLMHGNSKDGLLSNLDESVKKWEHAPSILEQKGWPGGEAKKRIAFLCSSSGTTGLPKVVEIPHYSVISNLLQLGKFLENDLDPTKMKYTPKVLGVLPFYHIYALIALLFFNVFRGVPVVVIPKFTWEGTLRAIVDYKITELNLVPPQVVLFAKSPLVDRFDLSHIRTIMSAAAPLSAELGNQLRRRFPNSFQAYGLTETSVAVTLSNKDAPSSSSGRLIPNVKCKVVDPATKKRLGPAPFRMKKGDAPTLEMSDGYRGELWVCSSSNALRYLGDEKATKETWDDEGYMHTGDEGYFDQDGNLYITDRIKELIKTKGMQVAPAELEGHLLGHPDVLDAGVIGIPDDYAGELPRAYIVLKPEASRSIGNIHAEDLMKRSIQKFVSEQKTRYKWLDGGVKFIDSIPKNPSGKILRKELRLRAKEEREEGKTKAKL